MANRAARIAIPILQRELKGKPSIALTGADCKSLARKLREALATHRHADGSEVHPCVIDEWANEPHRRQTLANLHNERRYRSRGFRRMPSKREISFQKGRLERSNYSPDTLRKFTVERGFDLAVQIAATMLRRFMPRHR